MPERDNSPRDRSRDENRDRSSKGEIPIKGQDTSRTGNRSDQWRTSGRDLNRSQEIAPFRIMRGLSNEMSRFFHSIGLGGDLMDQGLNPQVDVLRRGENLVVRADLPGLSKDDISVDVSGDVLTIRGERREETSEEREGYYWHERRSGSFSRSIPLPDTADPARANARFENGVLEVSIPAPETERSHKHHIDIG